MKWGYLSKVKIKVGTQFEEQLYRDLKVAAAQENWAIGDVIQEAVCTYLRQKNRGGLLRLLENDPLRLTEQQLRASMEADFLDQ